MVRGKTSEIKEFIDYSVSKGISKDQVKEILKKSGWTHEVIEKIFSETGSSKKGIPPTGRSILRMANVTKSFGTHLVLDNIRLSIHPGEIFGVIGLTGSGKTTLLNTMIGFVEPDEGMVIIKSPEDSQDYVVSKRPQVVHKYFGFAAQHPSFYDKLTVYENIDHFSSLYNIPKKERKQRCTDLIKMVGLWNSKDVLAHNLSGGMQKRLDIACSLVHNPSLLILDEPTADLDPLSRDKMWDLLRDINSYGTTIILASHFVNELESLCSRFAILHKSRLLQVGTPDELRDDFSRNYEVNLIVESKNYNPIINELVSRPSLKIQNHTINNKTLTIFTQKPEKTLSAIAKLIDSMDEKIIDINIKKPTIRELFESLVSK